MRYIPPFTSNRLVTELTDEDDPVARRLERIAVALSELPISTFSTPDGPNSSGETAARKGQIGVETGSSLTPLWVATSSGTGNWSALSFA